MNFYVCNGAVIVPVTGAETDTDALARIGAAFPGREIVAVPGAVLAYGGGGPHCITQQVPAVAPPGDAMAAEIFRAGPPHHLPRARARPSARRCGSARSRNAGTPIPSGTCVPCRTESLRPQARARASFACRS